MRVYIHVYYPSIYHLHDPLPPPLPHTHTRVIQVGKMAVVELENATNKTPLQTAMVNLCLPDVVCMYVGIQGPGQRERWE